MAKLPSGTRKRKDGKLEKRFTINGNRYSVYGMNTKEITEKEQVLRNQIMQGCLIKDRNITLDKYYEYWIKHKKQSVKINSIRLYKSHYDNHIKNFIGNKKIKDIKRSDILMVQDELLNTLNPNSVNHVIIVLNMILNDAVVENIIPKNPAMKIKSVNSNKKTTETKHRALTKQEQEHFMQTLKGNYYYSFIALMLASGMRYGEVGALTWQDIDYKANVIHVTKTLTKNEKGTNIIGDSAKSDSGVRDIPMNDVIKRILSEHRNKSDLLPFRTCNVFVSPYGNIIGNLQINNAIKDTLKELDAVGIHIEPFTSHAMRDTFATRYIEQGGNMQTLQKILGHSSITMTMDIYAHVLPDTKQDEMNKIQICIGM